MRLLRGLGSQLLPCGCLAGIYETYAGSVVTIVDARGPECQEDMHRVGEAMLVEGGAAAPVAKKAFGVGSDRGRPPAAG